MDVNPLYPVLGAIGISLIGFLLLDQNVPAYSGGLIWVIQNGTIFEVPYRYFLVLATMLLLFAGYRWHRRSGKN
jgi:hypothetical protein